MRSAWICTRNDVLGNLAVLIAAFGVFGTGTGWPDILVAGIMASLALEGAFIVVGRAWGELYRTRRYPDLPCRVEHAPPRSPRPMNCQVPGDIRAALRSRS